MHLWSGEYASGHLSGDQRLGPAGGHVQSVRESDSGMDERTGPCRPFGNGGPQIDTGKGENEGQQYSEYRDEYEHAHSATISQHIATLKQTQTVSDIPNFYHQAVFSFPRST